MNDNDILAADKEVPSGEYKFGDNGMTRDDIIRMAHEAGWEMPVGWPPSDGFLMRLERFAALVAAAERESMTKDGWRRCAVGQRTTQFCGMLEDAVKAEREKSLKLWMLLDDVDTADDIAKDNDIFYRNLCRIAQQKRWTILNGDEVDAAIRARGEK